MGLMITVSQALTRASRGAEALGYPRQSPPARNANSNGDPLDYRLSPIGYRLCGAKPACAERELQRRPSRPLAIGYRLSALWGKARLRGTRTPTVTLSTIGYRLSAIGSVGQSPPARNANSNSDPIGYRLSVIGSRLSAIAYRLSPIAYRQRRVKKHANG